MFKPQIQTHKPRLFFIITFFLFLINSAQAIFRLQKLDTQGGFQIIQLHETPLIQNYTKILHVIDTNDLQETLTKIEQSTNMFFKGPEDLTIIKQLKTQINKTSHNIRTLTVHRKKRGLINFGGSTLRWLFGTMDNDDRAEIETHLHQVDLNNHNSITAINQQIKINNDLENNLNTLQKQISKDKILTENLLNTVTDTNRQHIKQIHFLQILNNINILNQEISKIQSNLAFAKHGVMTNSILTSEEIELYQIDSFKYQEIKSSIFQKDEKLIFVISIPNLSEQLAQKIKILQIPNDKFEEISLINSNFITHKNKTFIDENNMYVKNLKNADECIQNLVNSNVNKCSKEIERNLKIIEISSNTILVKNAENLMLKTSANNITYILNKNYLIIFSNCTVELNNIVFTNKENYIFEHIMLPNYLNIENVELKANLKDVHLKQIENIKQIEEIKMSYKNNNKIFYTLILILLIIALIVLILYFVNQRKSKSIKLKFQENKKELNINYLPTISRKNDVQEDIKLKEGEALYPLPM